MTLFLSDRPLLAAFRAGRRSALARTYHHYFDVVSAAVCRGFSVQGPPPTRVPGVVDRDAQGETVQEVFCRAFAPAARERYDGQRRYQPYLMRIARNLRIDQLRRAGREVPASALGEDVVDRLPDASEEPPDPDWQALRDVTTRWIRTQDAETRRFIELRFEQGRSQADVARLLGVGSTRPHAGRSCNFRAP